MPALFVEWPIAGSSILGVSFVFADKHFELSRFVVDAVVVADGAEFRRDDVTDLPEPFRATLAVFEDCVQMALAGKIGNAVATMAELYGHQLHSGQAYLTFETLTVMNIRGENLSGIVELTPTLPYTVTTLLTGTAEEIATRNPECCDPGGTFWLVDWVINNRGESLVSQRHLKSCFRNLRNAPNEGRANLKAFREVSRKFHQQEMAETAGPDQAPQTEPAPSGSDHFSLPCIATSQETSTAPPDLLYLEL